MQGMVFPPKKSHSGDKPLPSKGTWEEFKENIWEDSISALQDWHLEGRSKVREGAERGTGLIPEVI